ncbi:MAG: glycosyltransferase family protein [Magnetovibrio sp.]|nr:glycosyltransferase family protein [Magnetovibrio sp.]
MTVAVIVQARMTSTRLPGKILMELGGETPLFYVLKRCAMIPGVDVVCCAIPDTPESDPIETEAKRCGAEVYRGSESDVLDRYYQAAKMVNADTIIRITSDCPLVDPWVCGETLELFQREGVDFASNNLVSTFPHGIECEVFTFEGLENAALNATEPEQREHVTPWLRKRPEFKRAVLKGPGGGVEKHRWTLDYPEDFELFQKLFEYIEPWPAVPGWKEIYDVVRRHPELAEINAEFSGHGRA